MRTKTAQPPYCWNGPGAPSFRGTAATKQKPIEIVTSFKTYKNMVIESLVINRNCESGDAIAFSCAAKEIRIVSQKSILIEEKTRKELQEKKDLGKKNAVEAPAEKRKSFLSTASSWFGG